ncbi:RNA polymerase subunit sigma [Acetivibrio straminisolvens]|uniref:RNA polymerase subunit sigma n=2 Tax=Acetivibrio straminisolvens TaxID=253314 RepID=UPI00223F410A|nr:RNA polymerase subunit sigma [Acetivibrio straminisolvens]
MFGLDLFKKRDKFSNDSIIEIIDSIRKGDLQLRDRFISESMPFIMKSLHKILKRHIDIKNDEEFSIGLSAFNEAIDHYDLYRKGDFYRYSYIMIKHRIIDYLRSTKRNGKTIPFSSIEDNEYFDQRYLTSNINNQYEIVELKEDILILQQNLMEFGITWDDLINNSPMHRDTRRLCIRIAKEILENEDLYTKFINTKKIPRSQLVERLKIHRRTIENHRIFIIAICLILKSNQDELKAFPIHFEERGNSL